MGTRSSSLLAVNRALSRTAGQDAVLHGSLSQAAVGPASGASVHGLHRSHGCAGANQRAKLWGGLLCCDFAGHRVIAQDGADSTHLPALFAGSAGNEISHDNEASG